MLADVALKLAADASDSGSTSLSAVVITGAVTITVTLIGVIFTRPKTPAVAPPGPPVPDPQDQLISDEIKDLRRQRNALQEKLDHANHGRATLQVQIHELQIKINWLNYICRQNRIDPITGEKLNDAPTG